MNGDQPINWLMFFTLAAGLVVITGSFLYFLRSQRNRDIAQEALAGDHSQIGHTPNGAGLELIGVAVFAVVVMGLLATGYKSKSSFETAQTLPMVGGSGMAQTVGKANEPKPYQPANPAADLRVAPAGSTTGAGPDNGGRPENAVK